jgi:hypothetical protein
VRAVLYKQYSNSRVHSAGYTSGKRDLFLFVPAFLRIGDTVDFVLGMQAPLVVRRVRT